MSQNLHTLLPNYTLTLAFDDPGLQKLHNFTMGVVASRGLHLALMVATYDESTGRFEGAFRLMDDHDTIVPSTNTVVPAVIVRGGSDYRGRTVQLRIDDAAVLTWVLYLDRTVVLLPSNNEGLALAKAVLEPQMTDILEQLQRHFFGQPNSVEPIEPTEPIISVTEIPAPTPADKPWRTNRTRAVPDARQEALEAEEYHPVITYHKRLFTPLNIWLLELGLLPHYQVGRLCLKLCDDGMSTIGQFAMAMSSWRKAPPKEITWVLVFMIERLLAEFPNILTNPPKRDFLWQCDYARQNPEVLRDQTEEMRQLKLLRLQQMDIATFLYQAQVGDTPELAQVVARELADWGAHYVQHLTDLTETALKEHVRLTDPQIAFVKEALAKYELALRPMVVTDILAKDLVLLLSRHVDFIDSDRAARYFRNTYGVVTVQDFLTLPPSTVSKAFRALDQEEDSKRLVEYLRQYGLILGSAAPANRKDLNYRELLALPIRQFLAQHIDLTDLFADRVPSLLEQARIKTVRDLVGATPKKLHTIRGVGAMTIDYLRSALRRRNLRLPMSRNEVQKLLILTTKE